MQEKGQSLKSRERAHFLRCRLRRNLRRRLRLLLLLLRLRLRATPRRQLNALTIRVAPGSPRPLRTESGGFWALAVYSWLGLADSGCGAENGCSLIGNSLIGNSSAQARWWRELDKD